MTATFTEPPVPVADQEPQVSVRKGATALAAREVQYQDKENDFGSFSFSMLNTDSNTATIDIGDTITFELDNVVDFIGKVEELEIVAVGEGEEAQQVTTFSGRSLLAEWDWGIVRPAETFRTWPSGTPLEGLELGSYPFDDTRYWNWATPELNRTSWTSAIEMWAASQYPPLEGPFGFDGAPEACPFPDGMWICPRAIDGDGSHPVGVWYATDTFTVASSVYDIDVWLACPSDDSIEGWLDGKPIVVSDHNEESAAKITRARIGVTAGTHRIVIKVTHLFGGTGDITGAWCAVFKHKATDLRGDGAGYLVAPLTSTDSSWKCLDFGEDTPGYTAGAVVLDAFGAIQDRGVKNTADWTYGFDASVDTTEDAWGAPVEVSSPNGKKGTELLQMMAETWFDFAYDPLTNNGRHLNLWKKGNRSSSSGVTLTPGVNCLALRHHATDDVVNDLITRWRDGTARVADSDSVTAYDRREGYLSVPEIGDGVAAFYAELSALAYLKDPTESAEMEFLYSAVGAAPHVGQTVSYTNRHGDVVTGPVKARTVNGDEDGQARITVEIGAARDDLQARADRYNRSVAHGTLDGRSETAVPVNASIISSQQMSPASLSVSGGGGTAIVGDRGSTQRPSEPFLAVKLEADWDEAGTSGATVVRVEKDGTTIGSVSVASGQRHGMTVLDPPVIFVRSNECNFETTLAGGHVGGSVRVVGVPLR